MAEGGQNFAEKISRNWRQTKERLAELKNQKVWEAKLAGHEIATNFRAQTAETIRVNREAVRAARGKFHQQVEKARGYAAEVGTNARDQWDDAKRVNKAAFEQKKKEVLQMYRTSAPEKMRGVDRRRELHKIISDNFSDPLVWERVNAEAAANPNEDVQSRLTYQKNKITGKNTIVEGNFVLTRSADLRQARNIIYDGIRDGNVSKEDFLKILDCESELLSKAEVALGAETVEANITRRRGVLDQQTNNVIRLLMASERRLSPGEMTTYLTRHPTVQNGLAARYDRQLTLEFARRRKNKVVVLALANKALEEVRNARDIVEKRKDRVEAEDEKNESPQEKLKRLQIAVRAGDFLRELMRLDCLSEGQAQSAKILFETVLWRKSPEQPGQTKDSEKKDGAESLPGKVVSSPAEGATPAEKEAFVKAVRQAEATLSKFRFLTDEWQRHDTPPARKEEIARKLRSKDEALGKEFNEKAAMIRVAVEQIQEAFKANEGLRPTNAAKLVWEIWRELDKNLPDFPTDQEMLKGFLNEQISRLEFYYEQFPEGKQGGIRRVSFYK